MSDISKCTGAGCPVHETCYRFVAPCSPHWQSWITPEYENGGCDFFRVVPI